MSYIYDPAKRQYEVCCFPSTDYFRADLKKFCRANNLTPSQVKITIADPSDESAYIKLSHTKPASDLQHQAEAVKAALDAARRFRLKELSCE